MAWFPEIRHIDPEELKEIFQGARKPDVPEGERAFWLEEAALRIARTGAKGVDFLLTSVPGAEAARVRAALLALSFVEKGLSARKRARICELAQTLLGDERAAVVAEAIDALTRFACPSTVDLVSPFLKHASPYVVGSACILRPPRPRQGRTAAGKGAASQGSDCAAERRGRVGRPELQADVAANQAAPSRSGQRRARSGSVRGGAFGGSLVTEQERLALEIRAGRR